jgi:hypothetical protein
MTSPIANRTTTPATTPPAIAPVLVLEVFELSSVSDDVVEFCAT